MKSHEKESIHLIALSDGRFVSVIMMVVPVREQASLGTSHKRACPYNWRIRQTLQITFLWSKPERCASVGKAWRKVQSRCCLSTLIPYGSLKVSSINAFLRLDCRSCARNSLEWSRSINYFLGSTESNKRNPMVTTWRVLSREGPQLRKGNNNWKKTTFLWFSV